MQTKRLAVVLPLLLSEQTSGYCWSIMVDEELYRTLQFLDGRFLKLAGADVVRTVRRLTPKSRAITLWGIFFSRYSRMRSSFPVSLVTAESFPFGLPSRMPSLLLRAKASFVRDEIMERSISAESEKAKAKTFEEMLSLQRHF